jgi:hypothetical protein
MDCQTPRPTYYERNCNFDRAITRLEGALKTMTAEWDLQTAIQLEE